MLFWIVILLGIASVATMIAAVFSTYYYPNISKTLQCIGIFLAVLFVMFMTVDIIQSSKDRKLEDERAEEAKAIAIQECKSLPDMEDRIICRMLLEKQ